MTPRQADKIIKAGEPVTVHNTFYNETFTRTFTRRDRWNIYTQSPDGIEEKHDRGELEIVAD